MSKFLDDLRSAKCFGKSSTKKEVTKPRQEPIKKRGEKLTKEMRLYKKEVAEYLAKDENKVCLILSPVCTKEATCVNHRKRRGKNLRNQNDWEPACSPCNGYIESHHAWAVQNGHLIPQHHK